MSISNKKFHIEKGYKLNLTLEKRRKRIEINKNRFYSAMTREKMSKSQTGKKASDETKLKMSQSHKGKKRSKDSVEKTAEKNKGKKRSKEIKEKFKKINTGIGNPQYNKIWVNDGNVSRCITKEIFETLPSNWKKGRIINQDKNGRFISF